MPHCPLVNVLVSPVSQASGFCGCAESPVLLPLYRWHARRRFDRSLPKHLRRFHAAQERILRAKLPPPPVHWYPTPPAATQPAWVREVFANLARRQAGNRPVPFNLRETS